MSGVFWRRGQTVLLRHAHRGKVLCAIPMIVVEDGPERSVLYLPSGTATKWTHIDFGDGSLEGPRDASWTGTHVLQIIEADASHATWVMWNPEWLFIGWYVNLQERAVRVEDGLVSRDHALDVGVSPDLEWEWLDEDHFRRIQELEWIMEEDAAAIRREGERVIARIESREKPFCEPWPEWRPDDGWAIPTLPADWEELGEAD